MSKPTTREELKLWALRRLGAPVLEINADDEQLDDRLDEALEKFNEYHHEGTEKMYLKAQIKASILVVAEGNAGDYTVTDTITGETSGATARVIRQSDGLASTGNNIVVRNIFLTGEFLPGETIGNGTITSTLVSVTAGEWDLKYVEVPDLVFGISRILHFAGGSSSNDIFDFQYQLRLHDLYNLTSTSMVYYTQIMQHISLIDFTLNPKPMMNFNRMQNRLYLIIDWDRDIVPGDYIVAECYRGLDPAVFPKVWDHPWLKLYTVELFRLQWGDNLYKYKDMQLPGGVTVNADGIIARAEAGIEKLEHKLISEQGPDEIFIG